MTGPRSRTTLALAAILCLIACHPARQAPGMDARDMSDDRGARAGRFRSPSDNSADANATDPADNGMSVESNQ